MVVRKRCEVGIRIDLSFEMPAYRDMSLGADKLNKSAVAE
jgi:hypothetical protein